MSPERRHLALGGALVLAGSLLYASLASDHAPVALVAPAQTPAPVALAPGPPPMPAPVAPAPPAPDLSQLRLHGLTATGAIIASTAGQRLVRLGRDVMPGVTLQEVRQHHAVLSTPAGRFELGFMGLAEAARPTARHSVALAQANSVPPPAAAKRTEVLQYRFGLAARRADGRITGFAVRNGAEMPLLQRAGLRAGDVLTGVNGQTFDSDEKVMELATEIAGSYTAEFQFERNGRRMRASLLVNPRT